MMNKQLLNVIMIALAANPYTNSINPGLVRKLTWLSSGLGKRLK